MRRLLIAAGSMVACIGVAHAETVFIKPSLVSSSDIVEQALKQNAGHASTSFSGNGQAIALGYQSSEPITVFLVPLKPDNTYVPMDFLRFSLPASEDGDVVVDLTVSPGWSPGKRTYLLNMLSTSGDASASFTKLEFVPANVFTDIGAATGQLFTTEPYLPSSYHALRGYRIYGHEFSLLLGVLCVLAALGALAFSKKGKRITAFLFIIIAANMLYAVRFGIDELSFAKTHLTEKTYGEAGSIHTVAAVLTTATDPKKDLVFVCRDGTNFKEKLLRYFAYPLTITSDPADAPKATYALVMDKYDWSVDTVVDKDGSKQTLRCGPINREGEKMATFDGGEVLFRFPSQR